MEDKKKILENVKESLRKSLFLKHLDINDIKSELSKLETKKKELKKALIINKKELKKLDNEMINVHREIFKIKFGDDISLKSICEEEFSFLSNKDFIKISNYLEENHPYITTYGCNDNDQILFSIDINTQSNEHSEKIEYLLTLIKPNENGDKIIYVDRNLGSCYSIVNGITIINEFEEFTKKFSSVKECLDYCYKYII